MKKEQFEWIHSWQDENFNSDLPRVLLVGDSITHNYQSIVREKLKGIAYVDYVATSYGIDADIYKKLVLSFAKYNQCFKRFGCTEYPLLDKCRFRS